MEKNHETGLVVRVTGGDVWVARDNEILPCIIKGRLRQNRRDFRLVAGDRIRFIRGETGRGVIDDIKPRKCRLSRFDPDTESGERVLVSNLDILFVVASISAPAFNFGFIDRVLASAERGGVRSCVCLNKTDLDSKDEAGAILQIYTRAGYGTAAVSARNGTGMDELAAMFTGGIYALVGESGVGKSSILMRIAPELDLKVRPIGHKSGRGKHTTSFSQLYPMPRGFLADTPGIQSFGFPGRDPSGLANHFPEFGTYENSCHFNPCTHSHEPRCGVKKAVEAKSIAPTRYGSYINLLKEMAERSKKRFS